MAEIRGSRPDDLCEVITAAAEFTGETPFAFCFRAGLEKARNILIQKEDFEKVYNTKQAS